MTLSSPHFHGSKEMDIGSYESLGPYKEPEADYRDQVAKVCVDCELEDCVLGEKVRPRRGKCKLERWIKANSYLFNTKKPVNAPDGFLSLREAEAILDRSTKRLAAMCLEGKFKTAMKLGPQRTAPWVIGKAEVEEWVNHGLR